MTLIIAEGVDGSGKSTLIAELSHLFGDETRVKHRGPLKRHPLYEYLIADLASYRPAEDTILCDRWHVGELIYGPLYRGRSMLTDAMRRYIELFLDSRGAYRLVMATPYEEVQRRLSVRGEDFLKPEHLRMVIDFYFEYAAAEQWATVMPGYNTNGLRAIMRLAKKRAEAASLVGDYPSYVGVSAPRTLLLADRGWSNPAAPFPLMPFDGTQGEIMFSALEMAGVGKRSFGIVDPEKVALGTLYEELGKPRVISLGSVAHERGMAQRIPSRILPHPMQFANRAYSTLNEYGAQLKEAIDG